MLGAVWNLLRRGPCCGKALEANTQCGISEYACQGNLDAGAKSSLERQLFSGDCEKLDLVYREGRANEGGNDSPSREPLSGQ